MMAAPVVLVGPGAPPRLSSLLEDAGCRVRSTAHATSPDILLPSCSLSIYVIALDAMTGPVTDDEFDALLDRARRVNTRHSYIAALVRSPLSPLFSRLQHECLRADDAPQPFPVASVAQLAVWITSLLPLWAPAGSRAAAERMRALLEEQARAEWPARQLAILADLVGGPHAGRRPLHECFLLQEMGSLSALAAASPEQLQAAAMTDSASVSVCSFFHEDYPAV